LLRCFSTLVDLEEPVIRQRDANESPYRLGVGNRVSPQFVAIATRTLCGRRASGRGFPAETTGRDSSSSARHLSTSPELSGEPKFEANEFDYSGGYAYGRIFPNSRSRDDCALET